MGLLLLQPGSLNGVQHPGQLHRQRFLLLQELIGVAMGYTAALGLMPCMDRFKSGYLCFHIPLSHQLDNLQDSRNEMPNNLGVCLLLATVSVLDMCTGLAPIALSVRSLCHSPRRSVVREANDRHRYQQYSLALAGLSSIMSLYTRIL